MVMNGGKPSESASVKVRSKEHVYLTDKGISEDAYTMMKSLRL